jgi:acyl-CoA thioesterase
MTEDYLHEIKVFENYEMALFEKRHVVVSSKVVESSLNYYGNAHGGYLFTMCDQVAGLTAISTGFDAVTMQSSINYMRAGRLEDCLTIEGFCVHDGRSTKIIEVTISNQRQEAVAKAIFTMYVTGEHQSKSQKKS